MLVVLVPLNLLLWRRPEDINLLPDGDAQTTSPAAASRTENVVDATWAAIDWTLARTMRTGRFWWIAVGYITAMYAWYAVQVHQTKYLVEVGFSPADAVWALGAVSLTAIPGQIALGHISDRLGRESVWSAACLGFVICYAALIGLQQTPTMTLLYVMVVAQGALGYGYTSVMGPIVAEIFHGRHYGTIFGTVMLLMISGGAVGPWLTGAIHDATGSYAIAFWIAAALSAISAAAIWLAAPRKVRAVAGQVERMARAQAG